MNGIEYLLNELTPDKGVKFTYPHPIIGGDHMAEFHMYITLNNEGKPFKVVSRLGERMFVDSIKDGYINLVHLDMMNNRTEYQMDITKMGYCTICDVSKIYK